MVQAETRFKRDELEEFLKRKNDRVSNRFFTGRSDLLAEINDLNRILNKDYRQGARNAAMGTATLIQGPPGIGKTSLLQTLQNQCIKGLMDPGQRHKTIPVYLDNPASLTPSFLASHIKDTLLDLEKELGTKTDLGKVRDTLIAASSVTFSVGILQANVDPLKIERKKPLVPDNYTVMLMIDEIQQVPSGKDAEAAKVLLDLQGGSRNNPILPILAGMPNSAEVLGRAGLYRFRTDGKINLYPLTPDEVRESFGKYLDYFNINGDEAIRQIWSDRMVAWSDCWPKHLQNCMLALGSELLRVKGDLTRVDDNQVKLGAMHHRLDYYETSYTTFAFENKYQLLGEIMAEIGLVQTGAEIEAIIRKKREVLGLDHQEQLNHTDGLNFNTLLRKGFIYPVKTEGLDEYSCSIPSLQSYAVARTGTNLHTIAYGGQAWHVATLKHRGLDINDRDAWGRTPLHIAAENNWDRVVTALLQEGADPEIRDHQDNRPLELAREGSASHLKLMRVTVAIGDNNPTETQQSKLTEYQSVSSRPKM